MRKFFLRAPFSIARGRDLFVGPTIVELTDEEAFIHRMRVDEVLEPVEVLPTVEPSALDNNSGSTEDDVERQIAGVSFQADLQAAQNLSVGDRVEIELAARKNANRKGRK